jgi:predicted DNA-binding protein with PD1-like motif
MEFKKFKHFYILKISPREEIQKSIAKFCKQKAKNGGFFIGIGAVDGTILAHYDVKSKKYNEKRIKKPLELASLIGNVCFSQGETIVHSHAVLADKNLKTFSGHLVEARVSGVCEIIFFPFNKKVKKVYDKITGLKLMELSKI